ncbi:MAG: sulfate adenylyltransferase subunit CysN [Cellvibrionaceae bacterium]|nr:sulfate adenylyltransferase subunit CysN [Cellvibrionaceae bacterium]
MSHQSELIAEDINAYLAQHERKELLRFLTCGSVDDGKSTLIGRLLHDTKMIYEDQLAAIESDSGKHGTTGEKIDLALLVDGLQAEREQGITIDVAYRYFSTAKRKFIIADTPGHEQYTRNMATGASTCDLAIILIDARHGVQTQTRRHSYIASLLGIKHIIVAVNKMDLCDFSEQTFMDIKKDYAAFAEKIHLDKDIYYLPLSALEGDNVVSVSERMPWYQGASLMQILESVEIAADKNIADFRFPVQYVNRPHLDFRGFCGTVASGEIRVGDPVRVLPSGKTSQVKAIVTYDGNLSSAFVDQSVTLTLEDEIDISRGDMLVHADAAIQPANHLQSHLVWMSEAPLNSQAHYFFKFASHLTTGRIEQLLHRVDVNTQAKLPADQLQLNDIGLVDIVLSQPVVVDEYAKNRATGAFIVIDRLSNSTVAAGMVATALTDSEVERDLQDFADDIKAVIQQYYPEKTAAETKALVKKITQYFD